MLAPTVIDGDKLKAAREAKGLSVAELASLLTLSNEQIRFIEQGGDKPFYTMAHKLLAVRKYANAMGIHYDEIVIDESASLTPESAGDAPPVAQAQEIKQPAAADKLRLAAVAQNTKIRRLAMIVIVILCISLALYARVRGSGDEAGIAHEQNEAMVGMPVYESPAEPVANAAAESKAVVPPAAESADAGSNDKDCPQEQAGAEIKSWSPDFQRKPDLRLHIVSPQGGSLCITDASGKTQKIILKPMTGQAISGKPPYTVRSSQLPQLELYLQGLRAKVPPTASVLRLVPTKNMTPPSGPSGNLAPEL